MARRRGFAPAFRSSARRAVAWSAGPGGIASPTANTKVLFAVASQVLVEKLTLTRILGSCIAEVAAQSVAASFIQIGVGIIGVTEQAFAAGVTSIPSPISDPQEHWLWQWRPACMSEATAPGVNDITAIARMDFDTKGQLKQRSGDVLVGIVDVVLLAGTMTVRVKLDSRVLDKLV